MAGEFTTDMGVLAGIQELNNRFEWYYGDVEPVNPRPFLNWGHLSEDLWKQRNAENTDWIVRGKLSEAYFGLTALSDLLDGSIIPAKAASCSGNSATATKLQTARTINGVAFDGTTDITIGVPQIAVYTGTVNNGATIPLPSGYTQEQCKWMVSLCSLHYDGQNFFSPFTFTISVDSNRRVTCKLISDESDAYLTDYGSVNYIIIGIK